MANNKITVEQINWALDALVDSLKTIKSIMAIEISNEWIQYLRHAVELLLLAEGAALDVKIEMERET